MRITMLRGVFLVLASASLWTCDLAFGQTSPPDGAPPDMSAQRRGPPPEALDACSGKKIGDLCSFVTPKRGTIEGTCKAPEGKPLACRPARRPPPPPQNQ
jgi:hypothetical protein